MSSFKEFSSHANHGDMNSMSSKKKASDIAKNRIDPETGAARDEQDDGMDRERAGQSFQDNRKPNNRERSQDRNTR